MIFGCLLSRPAVLRQVYLSNNSTQLISESCVLIYKCVCSYMTMFNTRVEPDSIVLVATEGGSLQCYLASQCFAKFRNEKPNGVCITARVKTLHHACLLRCQPFFPVPILMGVLSCKSMACQIRLLRNKFHVTECLQHKVHIGFIFTYK